MTKDEFNKMSKDKQEAWLKRQYYLLEKEDDVMDNNRRHDDDDRVRLGYYGGFTSSQRKGYDEYLSKFINMRETEDNAW